MKICMENAQEILAFAILGIALAFLLRKFFFKNKNSNSHCGNGDCGCK